MSILRAANQLVLAGPETTYGTAATLTGANAIQCDFEITPMEATTKTREFSRPYFGARPAILTEIHRSIKMTNLELAGSGDPETAPAWMELLRCCGWAVEETLTQANLTLVRHATDSATISPSIDGEQFKMVGARGTASFMFEIGEIPKIEVNAKGGWVNPATLVSVPTPDYSAWQIPRVVNCENTAAISINAVDYPFYSVQIEQNNTVEFFCVPGEEGYRIEVTAREVKGKIKVQAKKISEHDLFALVKSGVLVPVALEHGEEDGEIVGFSMPHVQLLNPRKSDYKGDLAWEFDFLANPTDAGDDELSWYAK